MTEQTPDAVQAAAVGTAQAANTQGQAPNSQPQAGTSTQQSQADSAAADQPKPLTLEEQQALQRELSEARKEAAKYRTEHKKAEEAAQAATLAAKPEAERAAAEAAALKGEKAAWLAERQDLYVEQAITRLAGKLPVVDIDAVARLLDRSALTFGDDGRPTNAEDTLRALLKDRPYLAGTPRPLPAPNANATAGTGAGPVPDLTADELAMARLAGMTPEKYAASKKARTYDEWQASQPAKA